MKKGGRIAELRMGVAGNLGILGPRDLAEPVTPLTGRAKHTVLSDSEIRCVSQVYSLIVVAREAHSPACVAEILQRDKGRTVSPYPRSGRSIVFQFLACL